MATKKAPKDRGKELMDEILALIPEEQRAVVSGLLSDERVLTLAGEHTLAKDEATRTFEHNRQVAERQNQWFQEHQPKLAEYDRLASTGALARLAELDETDGDEEDDLPTGKKGKKKEAPAAQNFVTPEQARAELDNRELRAAQFSSYMATLAVRHYDTYKKELDAGALLTFCREKGLQMDRGGYEAFTQELRDARTLEATKEREKTIRAEERQKTLEEVSAKGPSYMGSNNYIDPKSGPASLDEVLPAILKEAKGTSDNPFTAAAAAKAYNTAVMQPGGGGA